MTEKRNIATEGYESVERDAVKHSKTSAKIHLPKHWAGKRVMAILLDKPEGGE